MNLSGEKKKAFQEAKAVIQTALNWWPFKERSIEVQVTVDNLYANWSLWQLQDGRRVLLGFSSHKLLPAGESYTPFEQ